MTRGRKPRASGEMLAALMGLSAQDWLALTAMADLGMVPTALLDQHIYGSRSVRRRRMGVARSAGLIETLRPPAPLRGQVLYARLGPAGKRALAVRGHQLGARHERIEMLAATCPEHARLIAEAYFTARQLAATGGGAATWTAVPDSPEGTWAGLHLEAPGGKGIDIAFVADALPWSPSAVAEWLRGGKRRGGVLVATDPARGAERARLVDPDAKRFIARRPAEVVARVWDQIACS